MWVALLNGFIGSMAAFGTDHDLMQRLLTVETRRESQRTLALTPVGTLLTLVIYLGLGAGLYTFYTQHPGAGVSRTDEILPHYVREVMPAALRGLMLSAIVLASIDSPLGSLSASFVTDIYRPLLVRGRSERHYLWCRARPCSSSASILGLIAWPSRLRRKILWLAFKIAGVTFGSLLGVFLLGLLTTAPGRRRGERRGDDRDGPREPDAARAVRDEGAAFAWSWLVILGTMGTMILRRSSSGAAPVSCLDRPSGGRPESALDAPRRGWERVRHRAVEHEPRQRDAGGRRVERILAGRARLEAVAQKTRTARVEARSAPRPGRSALGHVGRAGGRSDCWAPVEREHEAG